MTDRWDQYIAVRGGAVEVVWDILARVCQQFYEAGLLLNLSSVVGRPVLRILRVQRELR